MELLRILECVSVVVDLPIETIKARGKKDEAVMARRIYSIIALDLYPDASNYDRISGFVSKDRTTLNHNIKRHRDHYNSPSHRHYTNLFNKSRDRVIATSDSPKFALINRLEQLYKQRIEVELAIATNEAALLAHDKMEGAK